MRNKLLSLSIALAAYATAPAAQTLTDEIAQGLAGLPQVTAAVAGRVTADASEMAVAGVRVFGTQDPVQPGDAWHMGSLGKAMTSTLVARFVDAGLIEFDTTIGEILAEAYPDMHPDWQDTPLHSLLTHLSGMEANLSEASSDRLADGPRTIYVAEVLSAPPVVEPGEFLYSNASYVVAGAMLEEVGGAPWEELILTHVFEPLGIESAGFGPPQGDAIQGHVTAPSGEITPAGQGLEADNIPAIAPAGQVHLSAADMLIYLRAHLVHDTSFLSQEAWDAMHEPDGPLDYAMGWGVNADGSLVHTGSNTMWYARAYVDPNQGEAIFVAVNSGSRDFVSEPVDDAIRALLGTP